MVTTVWGTDNWFINVWKNFFYRNQQATQGARTWHGYPEESCTAVIHECSWHDYWIRLHEVLGNYLKKFTIRFNNYCDDSLYFGFDTMISCLEIVQFKQYGWSIGQTEGDTCCYLNKCSQLLKCFRKIIFSCITSWYPSSITARNCRVSLLFHYFSSCCSESLSNISFLIFFKHHLDQTFEVIRIRKMFRQFDLM